MKSSSNLKSSFNIQSESPDPVEGNLSAFNRQFVAPRKAVVGSPPSSRPQNCGLVTVKSPVTVKAVSEVVVKCLMPLYKGGKILDRPLFKLTAKLATNQLCGKLKRLDEKRVAEYVSSAFAKVNVLSSEREVKAIFS